MRTHKPSCLRAPLRLDLMSLLTIALLILCTGLSPQAGAADLAGEWEGSFTSDDRPIQVQMSVPAHDGSGRTAPRIHYGSPRNCRIDFEPTRIDYSQKPLYFGIDKTSGGYCLKFIEGYMLVTFTDEDTVSVDLFSKSRRLHENMTLRQQAK